LNDHKTGFHRLYYNRNIWLDTFWMGVPVAKAPTDLIAIAEILHATRPEVLIETGSYYGGSALFYAHAFDILRCGHVLSIDTVEAKRPVHPRITWAYGPSTDPEAVAYATDLAQGKRTMVVLDSDHHKQHVLDELDGYAPLVTPGCYLIVEDTNVNGHPVAPDHATWTVGSPQRVAAVASRVRAGRTSRTFLVVVQPRRVPPPSRGVIV
jgi:cephalosporin hydroxylase